MAVYTTLFGNITYSNLEIKNIFEQIKIDTNYLTDNKLVEYYRIKDGQTPDIVADIFYNDKTLYWLILLINDMRDYFYDWPMSDKELYDYIDRYAEDQDDEITELAEQIQQTGELLTDIKGTIKDQIYRKFYNENDNKKLIKVLKSEYLDSLLEQINKTES